MTSAALLRSNFYCHLFFVAGALISLWPHYSPAQLPAFPGAEGFGRFATGGRGGSVVFVTNTNDSGPGSFREAVSVGNRTVIFRVGGVIDYKAPRYAPQPNITIAGQTAPGDGVTIYGNGLSFSGSHNNIVRFIRVRQGIKGDSGTDAIGIANGRNMIFDHIAVSWGRDETFSISPSSGQTISNITIQSSIISQGLQGHSAGGLIQTMGGVSILRNLYIDNDTRNPKVKFVNEFVNNVVCNWETIGYNMGGDSAGDSYVNMFNNYFIRGPASGSTAIGGGNANFHIYAANNWLDGNRNGILDGTVLPIANYGPMDLQPAPYSYPVTPAAAYSPLTALKLVISDVGPSFRRDYVDELMIEELISWGTKGGTITSELLPPMNGPGVIRNGPPYPDADNDGMPDFWENGTGSNPVVANNNQPSPSGSGYTRLEDYLNWLAEPHGIALLNTNVVVDLRQFTRGWVVINRNPTWSVHSPVNGTVTLLNGYFAQFTPTPDHHGPASFQFIVNDDDSGPLTRTMNLFFTPAAQSYQPVWHGDDLANNWNTLGDYNWHDGISLLYRFHPGDAVRFDDTGSTKIPVNLIGSLQPASVTVDAKQNYTFSGSGSLDGSMMLLKTNTGTLRLNNTNAYTGATLVSNGVMLVNGALLNSPVTVRASGTVGGQGILGNGLTAFSGASILPGDGSGATGTLTISNHLTLNGGVTNRFDLTDDPTGPLKTNDHIHVIGNINLTGVNPIRISLLDGLPGNGLYTLFTYTGTLNGSLANLVVSGVSGTLTNPPGAIAILVEATRPPADLVWAGVNNQWDNGTSVSWLNDGSPDRFLFGDAVQFDNTGTAAPDVNLQGELTPSSVTVNANANYTFNGPGKISGPTSLLKTNGGTLTINAINDFTGPTIIGGGVLSVSQLANGGVASPIGAAGPAPENLSLNGGVLRYTGGNVALDRGATFGPFGAIFDVTGSGTTLTWNGEIVGSGALIKTGPGTLTLAAENSFSGGTILNAGTLALFGPAGGATVTANNYGLGSGSVTLNGGTLRLFGGGLGDAGAGYGNFSRPLIVPEGATATILTPARYTMSSSLTGSGTLNLEVNYVRGALSGNWSAFTGTINVTAAAQAPSNGSAEFRVANSSGYAGATIFLNDGVVLTQSGSGSTMDVGALGGTSGSAVGPGNSTSSGRNFRIGWNNADAVFAGRILADGQNSVTKVGTGNWTLTGANTYTAGTIVNGGTLTVNNTSGSGTGTGSVIVSSGATLAGTGTISGATTIAAGATLSPGNGGIGTLTINNPVTLAAGSTTLIEINKTAGTRDQLNAGSSTLTYGGTLIVTNLSGTLANGDGFKIFNAGTYANSFATMSLPPLPEGLIWNTNSLTTSGTITVVSADFTGPQSLVWQGDGSANVWDTTTPNWLGTNGTPRAFANDDSVTFNESGSSSPAINLVSVLAPSSVTVMAEQNYTFAGTGGLTGNMRLIKNGSGILTLVNSGGNNFSGGTTINGGTLQLGNGISQNGSLTGNVTNHGTLIFANATAQTSSINVSGPGVLIKNSPGTLTLNGNLTYNNLTIVNAGTLDLPVAPPPGGISNNSLVIFRPNTSITYSGSMSGSGSLNINASGQTITLNGTSTYSGGTTNSGGTLNLSSDRATGTGPVVYLGQPIRLGNGVVITNTFVVPSSTSDGMLDCVSGTATWAGDIVLTGGGAQFRPSGVNGTLRLTGNGAFGGRNFIIHRGTVEFGGNANFSATGGACSFGRNTTQNSCTVRVMDQASLSFGAFSLGGGQAGGGMLTLTIQNNGTFSTGVNNFDLHNSTAANAVTVVNLNGGTLAVGGFSKTRTGANQLSTLNLNGGTLRANQANASFLNALSGLTVNVRAGGAVISTPPLTGITIAAPLLHDAALGAIPDGGLTVSGVVTLTGANTYTGPTKILPGTLAVNSSSTIASSSSIYIAAGADLNTTAAAGFTLNNSTLWGNGSVTGSITLGPSATLSPGSNQIGRFTFTQNATLSANSTTILELNRTASTNDVVVAGQTLTLGGTLIVTNLNGSLVAGDSFQLFQGNVTGAFHTFVLPPLNPGLAWTNRISTSGSIAVISTAPTSPPVLSAAVNTDESNLLLSGSNGMPHASYVVLATTNVALPMIQWSRLATNQFDATGVFNLTNPINPATPQLFYRIELP